MSRSTHPTKPVRDDRLAGEFARQRFGRFGVARSKSVRIPTAPKRSFTIYEVGVCDRLGGFVVRGSSSYDFAEAFFDAGHPMDVRDPLFTRDDLRKCNEIVEAEESEQVEMPF